MAEQILLVEGLLDEEQLKGIQLGKMGDVVAGVGLVRIHLQRYRRPCLAHHGHRLKIPSRLNLQFDTAIPGIHISGDFLEKRV